MSCVKQLYKENPGTMSARVKTREHAEETFWDPISQGHSPSAGTRGVGQTMPRAAGSGECRLLCQGSARAFK